MNSVAPIRGLGILSITNFLNLLRLEVEGPPGSRGPLLLLMLSIQHDSKYVMPRASYSSDIPTCLYDP